MTRDFNGLIERSYKFSCEQLEETSRLEWAADNVFDITTYDSGMSELFASVAIDVCQSISDNKTFDLIADNHRHTWYLMMCNLPFFADRIEWGTSIRGARWRADMKPLSSCGIFDEDGEQVAGIEFERGEWKPFISALIDFTRDHCSRPILEQK